MIVRLVLRFGKKRTPSQQRDQRFRRLIQAASQTSFYEPFILSGTGWTEAELRDLPYVEFGEVKQRPDAFRNSKLPVLSRQELHFPFPKPARTAVLAPGFAESDSLYSFPNGWSPRLNQYEPEVLAAPVERLRQLALAVQHKRVRMAPVRRALLAFVGFDQGMLRREDRELFWRVFGVPVFEQVLVQGETLATECEAHEGLHVFGDRGIFEFREQPQGRELVVSCLRPLPFPVLRWATGMMADLHEGRCGCGECQPRILPVTQTAEIRRLPELVVRPIPITGAARVAAAAGR